MGQSAKTIRHNRTITVDFQDQSTYFPLLSDGKAFVEFVLAFLLALGFQRSHKATCGGGGCLTRHSHYARVRLGGLTIWRMQCTSCKAVFTVLPHFVLRYRRMSPEVARHALIATHGGLSLAWCATIYHISPMALYHFICALGHHSLVTVFVKCRLALPVSILADEKHSRCLTDRVSLPTIVSGRVLWHLGDSASKSAAAFTESYGAFQRLASHTDPAYQVKGARTDGFDSTASSRRTLFPRARLGHCLRHALNKLPRKLIGLSAPIRQDLRSQFHALLHRCRQRKSLRVVALGQRLRHFADHITTTGGEAHGERVRNWFRDKKAGWYAVLEDPRMPASSTLLDQAHNAIDRKLFAMKGFHHPSGRQAALLTGLAHLYNLIPYQLPSPACGSMWGRSGRRGLAYARLDAQPANPHLGRVSVRCGNSAPLNPVECGTASGLLPISGMSVCRSRNGCRKPAPRPRGRNWGGRPFLRDDETGNWLRGLLIGITS